ncbi:UNVERIFIED_CONTAM: hypothetical protein GTU68_050688 [Idotea baltica]|nr:hypothetical protein [Idotea baltica]
MKIDHIKFVASYTTVGTCPAKEMPEYAFIGRSNVGKSTLINYLAGRKDIAKTSRTPGKTQLINFFEADERWHLVDLPGYGYAKVSKKDRAKWGMMVKNYLRHRLQMQTAFILVDSNVPLQEIDLEMINWMGEQGIPFSIVFTKSDRMTSGPLNLKLDAYKVRLSEYWETLPRSFVTSSNGKQGRDELLDHIDEINRIYYKRLKS